MTEGEDNSRRDDESNDETESERERTKRYVRRIGYVVFIGGGFAIFVMMLVGVVQGIRSGRAWNPYTGLPQEEGQCLARARRLVVESGRLNQPTSEWIGRYRDWQVRCKEGHPSLYDLLESTRHNLQRDGEDGG